MAGSYVTNPIVYAGVSRSLQYDWYVYSQNISGNYTVVRWKLQGWGQTSKYVNAENFTQTVGSNSYSSSTRRELRYQTVVFGFGVSAGETIIYHDSAGKAQFSARSGAAIGYYGSQNTTGSGTWTLPTIARASSISSVVASEIGKVVTVNISRASTGFVHKVWYRMPGQGWVLVTENAGANATFTLPMSACSYLPNSTNGSLEIAIQTMYGGKPIGGEVRSTKNVSVPSSLVPSFASISHSENVTAVKTLIGAYVQNRTKLDISINSPAGVYGSAITGYRIEVPGTNVTGKSSIVSNPISSEGSVIIKATVTDSRGRTTSKQVTINVLAYKEPTIENVEFIRCTSAGEPDPLGIYVKVIFKAIVHSLKVGATEKNKLNYKVLSKRTNESSFTTKSNNNHSSLSYDSYLILSGYPQDYAYNFNIKITDIFGDANSTTSAGLVAIGQLLMQWHKLAMSIGMMLPGVDFNLYIGEKGLRSSGPIVDKDGLEVIGFGGTLVEIDE